MFFSLAIWSRDYIVIDTSTWFLAHFIGHTHMDMSVTILLTILLGGFHYGLISLCITLFGHPYFITFMMDVGSTYVDGYPFSHVGDFILG